jgi:hypothetical protein
MKSLLFLVLAAPWFATPVWASDLLPQNPYKVLSEPTSEASQNRGYAGVLLAQNEGDDTYDPFADYSEFDEASDEEADINFFRNGRFFTLGFTAGYRSFTGNKKNAYGSAPAFGVYLSYFFDLRFALQFSFMTSDHDLTIKAPSRTVLGNVSFTSTSFNLKYYMNTQNVTRGLADLNPYLFGGFSQYYRTITADGFDGFSKDTTLGYDFGVGLEIPMMKNKMYFGIQGAYHIMNFKDDNTQIILSDNDEPTGVRTTGAAYDILGILGINF